MPLLIFNIFSKPLLNNLIPYKRKRITSVDLSVLPINKWEWYGRWNSGDGSRKTPYIYMEKDLLLPAESRLGTKSACQQTSKPVKAVKFCGMSDIE